MCPCPTDSTEVTGLLITSIPSLLGGKEVKHLFGQTALSVYLSQCLSVSTRTLYPLHCTPLFLSDSTFTLPENLSTFKRQQQPPFSTSPLQLPSQPPRPLQLDLDLIITFQLRSQLYSYRQFLTQGPRETVSKCVISTQNILLYHLSLIIKQSSPLVTELCVLFPNPPLVGDPPTLVRKIQFMLSGGNQHTVEPQERL